jgi:hypothetical protein
MEETELYQLVFTGKSNKFQNIEKIVEDESKFSVVIAKQLSHLRICGTPFPNIDEFIDTMIRDLRGKNYLAYVRSWEKILTLAALSKDSGRFKKIYDEILEHIKKLNFTTDNENDTTRRLQIQVRRNLKKYLDLSVSITLALLSKEEKQEYNIIFEDKYATNFHEDIQLFREGNLIRHHYVAFPLLNYIKGFEGNLALVDVFNTIELNQNNIELDENKIEKTPRFIHSHELQLYYLLRQIILNESSCPESYIEKAIQKSEEISHFFRKGNIKIAPKRDQTLELDLYPIHIEVKTAEENDYSKIRIGLANLNVDEGTLEKSYEPLESPDISLERWLKISNLLNTTKKEKCDLLIFPECSIPYMWLTELTRWVREHQIGIIFGMEYLYRKNI